MSAILTCNQVAFAYPGKPPLLQKISLTLEKGGFYWLRGPSGGGKSTFLRLLCRLLEPTGGSISFGGEPVTALDPPRLRRQMVYLQQIPVLLPASVRENLLLPFSFKINREPPLPPDEVLSAKLHELLLDDVSLEAPAAALSVGQKQRLCLLRAMLLSPPVLLLDEPLAALDLLSAGVVLAQVFKLHREQGTTILMVAHGRELSGQTGITGLTLHGKTITMGG